MTATSTCSSSGMMRLLLVLRICLFCRVEFLFGRVKDCLRRLCKCGCCTCSGLRLCKCGFCMRNSISCGNVGLDYTAGINK